jgi:oligosaccharyltransferase complex subunit beta
LDITLSAEKNSVVIDHFQHDVKSAAEEHDVLVLNVPDFSGKKIQNFFTGNAGAGGYIAIPRAVGQVLGNESPLLHSIVKAPSTAYIHNPKEDADGEEPFATGAQISLVTSFQARNSARFTVLGSAEALEDKWFDTKLEVQLPGKGQKSVTPENKVFAQQVAAWTFKEAGVLKVGQIRHYLNEGAQEGLKNASDVPSVEVNPELYRIKNNVHYEIEISEWANGRWAPFTVPAGDALQLEFSMLRRFMPSTSSFPTSTVFSTSSLNIADHSILLSRRKIPSQCVTSLTMSGRDHMLSVAPGLGLVASGSRLLGGSYLWLCGCTANLLPRGISSAHEGNTDHVRACCTRRNMSMYHYQ